MSQSKSKRNNLDDNLKLALGEMKKSALGLEYNLWEDGKLKKSALDEKTFDFFVRDAVKTFKTDREIRKILRKVPNYEELERRICELVILKYLDFIRSSSSTFNFASNYLNFYEILKLQLTALLNEFQLSILEDKTQHEAIIKKFWKTIIMIDKAIKIPNIIDAYGYLAAEEKNIDSTNATFTNKIYNSILRSLDDPENPKEYAKTNETRDSMYG
ncbi:MAG: hypothetical protein ACP5TL_02375 [Candidatus Micrarchaeia archaeon]